MAVLAEPSLNSHVLSFSPPPIPPPLAFPVPLSGFGSTHDSSSSHSELHTDAEEGRVAGGDEQKKEHRYKAITGGTRVACARFTEEMQTNGTAVTLHPWCCNWLQP